MMTDFRLLLLLHTPAGLKLSSDDLESLLEPSLDIVSSAAVVAALRSEKARAFVARHADWVETSRQVLAESERVGVRWVTLADDLYPRMWRGLSERPTLFSFRGEPVWQKMPLISIVGSRTPATDTLQWMQRELPAFLKGRNLGVVSGGARGVDQWAHRLAMDCLKPTVCVLPSGLLNPYPPEREDLWERIVASGGCLISTCALNAPMLTHYFTIRNRWIAGLAPLCFVVEANRRSGSLITAKRAVEESRTLCTLPVFPTAEQGLGNLDLIAAGAFMLRDHRDLATLWEVERLRV